MSIAERADRQQQAGAPSAARLRPAASFSLAVANDALLLVPRARTEASVTHPMAVERDERTTKRTPPLQADPPGPGDARPPTSGAADEDRTIPLVISQPPAADDDRTVSYPVPYPPPPPRPPTEAAQTAGEPAAAAPGATRAGGGETVRSPGGVSQQPPAPAPPSKDVTIVAPLPARGPRL